jgi:cysteine sulfinate desulfinase/cysteine desulfurase-like protein
MVGEARAASAVRASLGEDTTDADVDAALERWDRVLMRARG